jgi:Fic family protein
MKWEFNIQDIQEIQQHYDRILLKKDELSGKRPLSGSALSRIQEGLSLEWTYNSNSIEGNTLSLQETRRVLMDGMTVKGKSMREHFEATNHHEAIEYLESLVKQDYVLNERDILEIHSIVLSKIEKEFAGRYRNGAVRIIGANFIPPNALRVSEQMEELLDWVNANPMQLNEVALASIFHHRFVHIHPFFDGNGRTVRLAMNLILMRSGFPPAIILKNDRKKYYDALNLANKGNYSKLLLLMAQAVERSLDIYLNAYPSESLDDDYRSISEIVSEPDMPYGQEYVSLLARQGKIDAYKEGRNWVTNKKAIKDYVNNKNAS